MKHDIKNNTHFNNNVNISKQDNTSINKKRDIHISGGQSFGIFKVIIFILLLVVLFKFLTTGEVYDFTFKSLIEVLASAPEFSLGFTLPDLFIKGPWPGLEFLRSFLNMNLSIFEIGLFLSSMILNGLHFILYLVTRLFM